MGGKVKYATVLFFFPHLAQDQLAINFSAGSRAGAVTKQAKIKIFQLLSNAFHTEYKLCQLTTTFTSTLMASGSLKGTQILTCFTKTQVFPKTILLLTVCLQKDSLYFF